MRNERGKGRERQGWRVTGALLVFMEFHAFGLLLIRRDALKKLAVLDCGFRVELLRFRMRPMFLSFPVSIRSGE